MTKGTVPPSRGLTDDEIELWLTVTAGIERRPGCVLPARLAKPKQVKVLDAAPEAAALPGRAARRTPTLPTLAPLERKLRQQLSRGRQAIDAAIDLHGFRQEQAHRTLRHFLAGAQTDGARVVLVVTGKGERHLGLAGPAYEGGGILRRLVPLWLGQPEFRTLVGGYGEASGSHGGAGALYVRLRRIRQR